MTDMVKVQVSPAEDLLYGPMAGAVRLVGQAAIASANAAEYVAQRLNESRDMDRLEADKTSPSGLDEDHSTPHTRWLAERYEQLYELAQQSAAEYRRVAADASLQWTRMRDGIQSLQMVSGSGDGG
jgi:hypothetical protein